MGANNSSHHHRHHPFRHHQHTIQPHQSGATCHTQTLHRNRQQRYPSDSSSTVHTPTCEVLRGAQSWSSLVDVDIGKSCQSSTASGHTVKSGMFASELPIPPKKKKNLSSLATLKKRLVRRSKRSSKSFDHGQIMREFLSNWSTRDLLQLVEEYESIGLLKELTHQAETARPSASSVSRDLSELYDFKYVADTYLIFRGVHFPVHKAILCVRSPFFRELLGKVNTFGARVPVNLDIPGLRPELFNDILRYLYSGELIPTFLDGLSSSSVSQHNQKLQGLPVTPGPLPSSYDAILLRLSEQFGIPNELDRDLKHLLETGLYSDASLMFSSGNSAFPESVPLARKCRACSDQSEFSCHSSVLASRSNFFRNVVQRRCAELPSSDLSGVNTANQKIRIVLDESIIPRRFARVILHAMYRDSNDLASVLPHCVCKCSYLNSPQLAVGSKTFDQQPLSSLLPNSSSSSTFGSSSTLTGGTVTSNSTSLSSLGASLGFVCTTSNPSGQANRDGGSSPSMYIREITDLYEIARFLELDTLIQACEDMMLEALTVDTLVPILKWSEQPHGSPWVKRQAMHFLREDFCHIANSAVLFQLESSHLQEILKSDFLQASELEILQSVIKWGENGFFKRMEEREPNVVSQTTHSVRRGVQKREMNDAELRDIISELMGHVRIGHILPLDSDILSSAAKRGLVATLPPYMLGEDGGTGALTGSTTLQSSCTKRGITAWLRGKGSGPFLSPRYFSPYVDECKAYLEERLRRPGEMIPRRDHRSITHVPDLYTLDKNPSVVDHHFNQMTTSTSSEIYSCCSPSSFPQFQERGHSSKRSEFSREVSSSSGHLPVVEQRILVLMKQREHELKSLLLSALGVVPNRCEVTKLIQLRVVREFGLPDAATEVLHNTTAYVPYPATETTESAADDLTTSYGIIGMVPSSGVLSNVGSNGALQSDKDIYCHPNELCQVTEPPPNHSPIPPPLPPNQDAYLHYSFEDEYLGGQLVKDTMPDIAMATSALAEMHLFKRSTESLALPPPPQRPHTTSNQGFSPVASTSKRSGHSFSSS